MVISAIGRLVSFSANPESAGNVNVTLFHAFALAPRATYAYERSIPMLHSPLAREKIANFPFSSLQVALSTLPKLN